jgi:hypothetical protein
MVAAETIRPAICGVVAAGTIRRVTTVAGVAGTMDRITRDPGPASSPMIYAVQLARPLVLLTLAAALLAPPPALGAAIDVRAVAGLPRISSGANGQVIAWRNIGVRAESEWIDAEVRVPTCLAVTPRPRGRDDDSTVSCGGTDDRSSWFTGGDHQTSITFKVPRRDDRLPWVDLSVRQWRSTLIDGSEATRKDGTAGTVVLTQPLAAIDAIAGYEVPLKSSADSGRWRTLFIGLAWRSAVGVAVEIVGERGVERASGAIDRALTLRLAHRFDATGARIAAWSTRSFDDPQNAWRLGLGVEFPF